MHFCANVSSPKQIYLFESLYPSNMMQSPVHRGLISVVLFVIDDAKQYAWQKIERTTTAIFTPIWHQPSTLALCPSSLGEVED